MSIIQFKVRCCLNFELFKTIRLTLAPCPQLYILKYSFVLLFYYRLDVYVLSLYHFKLKFIFKTVLRCLLPVPYRVFHGCNVSPETYFMSPQTSL